jgi:diguanylate cyclase (GGDEF)-like protein/PAS domain S-box-containing protein
MLIKAGLGRGATFALVVLIVALSAFAATAYGLWQLRVASIDRRLDAAAMNAHALEDHLTQSFNVIDRTLANIADQPITNERLSSLLRQAPYLRSLVVLGPGDVVVASSNPANIGLRLSRQDFLPQAETPVEVLRVGPLRLGRDFHMVRAIGQAGGALTRSFIPVEHDMQLPDGRWVTAAAAVNPDYFLNFYGDHIAAADGKVQLLRYDGRLLLSSDEGDRPGSERDNAAIRMRVERTEAGRFEQVLSDGRAVFTAYRASRAYPFVLTVHLDKEQGLAAWRQEAINTLLTVSAVLLAALALASVYFLRYERSARERERAEESLRTLSLAVEQSPVSIVITDPEAVIQYVNPKFESITGYSAAEVIGKNPKVLSSGEKSSEEYRDMWAAISAGRIWQGEFHNRRKDGTLFWEWASISPVFNEQGVLQHFVAVKEDITARKQAEEKIGELNRDFVSFLENTSDFVYFKDRNSRFRFCSQTLADITGHASWRDMAGKHDLEVFPPETAQIYYEEELPVFETGQPILGKIDPYIDKAGDRGWVSTSKWPLFDADGQVTGLFGISRDVTERFRSMEKLQLAANVFTHAREGIMITNASGDILDINEAFSRITGYAREDVLGRNPRMLSSGRQERTFYEALWHDLIEHGYWYGEVWNRRKNGEVFAVMQTISAVRNEAGHVRQYLALFSDITPMKEHERQLEQIAHFDALTQLPNRVLLADRLHQAMNQARRRDQRLAVAYLDLDGFKAVNDSHGHDAGDQLLITLAARMKAALRDGDTLARLGGDEFVAVMLDLDDIPASLPMLARLLAAAAQPVHVGAQVLQVSASIGVTFFPQLDEVDADQLMRQADQAMYQAKLAGKNRYHVFDAEQDRSLRGLHESLEHIRRALDAQEFVLYYQPKVNMRSGAVIGAEALIRWQHPDKGLLPPSAFLPVIEEHPLAVELGEWVIASALAQMAAWRAEGFDIPVSVNLSARQLQQTDFVQRLRELLAAQPGARACDLELEVLETSALDDLAHASQVIQACLDFGVRFALDDFGTGYASLAYLKRLPVAMLKIDQSFVRDMLFDPDDLAILEGVIGLATAFRRQIIAEGVETVVHGEMLLRLGCEMAQGFGIARPMPAAELPAWAASWRPDPCWLNKPAVSRDDLALLFAGVEHQAWILGIESCIQGELALAPPLDPHDCRFGQWLNSESRQRYGAHPAFNAVENLHREVHVIATSLLELHASGHHHQALAGMMELHRRRDALLLQLNNLLLPDDF